ncbi:MAG: hypothetical protein ACREJ2_05135 [Planctomycetota bacterium]
MNQQRLHVSRHRGIGGRWGLLGVVLGLACWLGGASVGWSAEGAGPTPGGAQPPATPPATTPATPPATPAPENKAVTALRQKAVDLIGKILNAPDASYSEEMLIAGQARLVQLVNVDKKRGLHYTQYGQPGEMAFDSLTPTTLSGLLTAMVTDDMDCAPQAHLTAGLLYWLDGKNVESSSEIAKAVQLDDSLDAVAQAQLKLLPKPAAPSAPDYSGLEKQFSGGGGGGGGASGTNYPAVPAGPWKCVGFGGGGSIYAPVISPFDPKVGMVACDMGGIYLTRDGGRHWQCLPRMRYSYGPCLAFSSRDPKVVFVGTVSMLYRSDDLGVTWKTVTKDMQYPQCAVWDVCVDPDDGNAVWVSNGRGTLESGMKLSPCKMEIERSENEGITFTDGSKGLKDNGIVRKIAVDRSSPAGNRTLYAATSDGFFRSTNAGASWEEYGAQGLPGRNLRDIVTLYNKESKKTTILVVMETGGIYRSEDGGKTFQPSGSGMSARPDGGDVLINAVNASWVDANVVWAIGKHAWKSTDGGRSWRTLWDTATKYAGGQLVSHPWSHDGGYGIACSPKNPEIMWYTGSGDLFSSNDGGASLTETTSHPMPEGTARMSFKGDNCNSERKTAPLNYDGGGLEVTGCYQVIPDPNNPQEWYTCFADVGSWRTEDDGASWIYNMGWWNSGIKPEWRNSVYEVAPDPRRPGRLYEACSRHHNLPGADIASGDPYDNGGLAVSADGGKTWTPFEKSGLPDKVMTSILIDKRSEALNTLWVAVYTAGVYRSTDDGAHFENVSRGLPSVVGAWRLRQASDGSILLATVNKKPGGIFKFDEKESRWKLLAGTAAFGSVADLITRPKGFVAAAVQQTNHPAKGEEPNGGIFVSYDCGATWKRMWAGNCMGVDRSPDGQWWFAATPGGLYRSLDSGATWTEDPDLPFVSLTDVKLNPKNPGELWLASFGCGAWKGSSTGAATPPPAPPPSPVAAPAAAPAAASADAAPTSAAPKLAAVGQN